MMPDCPPGEESGIQPDPEMLAEGWTRRFLADPERAAEMVDAYVAAGYEAVARPVTPGQFDGRCGDCPAVVCRTYVMIYTRPRP